MAFFKLFVQRDLFYNKMTIINEIHEYISEDADCCYKHNYNTNYFNSGH